jgi:hypothetical protein
MRGTGRPLYLLALLACIMTSVAWAQSGFASAAVPLELIVKFSRDSEVGRRIDDIINANPADLSRLSDLQGQLLQSTGFILIPERVTSGQELILRVPEEPLLEEVKKTLAAQQGIASAELVAIQNQNPRLPESKLLVRFPPSAGESALLNKALADPAYHAQIQALTLRLCAPSDIPVLGSVDAADTLTVTVDRYALLEKLVGQLNALADVDYAQPNSTVQFMK